MKHDLILSLENQWFGRSAGRWQAWPAAPVLRAPARIVTDFGSTVAGVMAIDVKPDFAAAVIEKRLRGEGLLEGDARILTHRIVAAGGGSRVFYTAIPAPAWQASFGWLAGEAALGLVFPVDAVMLAAAREHDIVLFASGRTLRLLVSQPDTLIYLSVSAYSDDIDDLQTALASLAARLRQQWPAMPQECSLLWCDLLAAGQAQQDLPEFLSKQCNARLTIAPVEAIADGMRPMRTAAAALTERLPLAAALNPWPERLAFLAEQVRQPVAAAAAAVAVLLLASAGYLLVQASQLQARADQVAQQTATLERSSAALDAPAEQLLQQYKPTMDFIDTLAGAAKSADALALLGDLRLAADQRVRVMRVRQVDNGSGFLVDGVPLAGSGLSGFLGALRGAGYQVSAVDPGSQNQQPGFFSYAIKRDNAGAAR